MVYILIIVLTDRSIKFGMLLKSLDSLVFEFVPMGTLVTARCFLPAWITVSIVYENGDTIFICMAASRLNALNPYGIWNRSLLWVSGCFAHPYSGIYNVSFPRGELF